MPQPITLPTGAAGDDPPPAPVVDWQAELARAARNQAARGVAPDPGSQRLDSKPEVMPLPARPEPPPRVFRRDNGDVVVRGGSVECESPRIALDEHFAAWARGRPARCRKLRGESLAEKLELEQRAYLRASPPE